MSALSESPATGSSSNYRFELVEGLPIVTLAGSLSRAKFTDVERAGAEIRDRLVETKPRDLLVDLTNLEYIGSSLVALVVRLWKTVKDRNGRTVVVVNHEGVQEVLEIAKLTSVWTLVESEDEGLRFLGVRRPHTANGGDSHGGNGGAEGASPLPAILSVLASVGAIGGTVLTAIRSPLVTPPIALGISVGAGVVGLVAGTLLLLRRNSGNRWAGAGTVLVCAGAIIAGLLLYPAN